MRVRRMSAQVRAKRGTCQRPSDMRIESADACILSRFRIRLHVETKMNVEKDKVATFHYHLTDAAGEVIDSSREAQPLTILVGHGALIPGMEQALIGHKVGDRFDIVVPPAEGYGERRDDFTQRVPKKYFRDADRLKPG